jgi:mannose-6-phosphate isomerase-like protein (cupin superfamily)
MNDAKDPRQTAIVKLVDAIARTEAAYFNDILTRVNDHVVRLSIMTEPYFWHRHPESDETFLVIEGTLEIEFENHQIVLMPGELMTIPSGVIHRTRPLGGRTVNLTVESAATTTEKIEMPSSSQP